MFPVGRELWKRLMALALSALWASEKALVSPCLRHGSEEEPSSALTAGVTEPDAPFWSRAGCRAFPRVPTISGTALEAWSKCSSLSPLQGPQEVLLRML